MSLIELTFCKQTSRRFYTRHANPFWFIISNCVLTIYVQRDRGGEGVGDVVVGGPTREVGPGVVSGEGRDGELRPHVARRPPGTEQTPVLAQHEALVG